MNFRVNSNIPIKHPYEEKKNAFCWENHPELCRLQHDSGSLQSQICTMKGFFSVLMLSLIGLWTIEWVNVDRNLEIFAKFTFVWHEKHVSYFREIELCKNELHCITLLFICPDFLHKVLVWFPETNLIDFNTVLLESNSIKIHIQSSYD